MTGGKKTPPPSSGSGANPAAGATAKCSSGPELAKKLEGAGLAKGKHAQQVAKWAADSGIIDRVERLLEYASKKLYRNPAKMVQLVEFIGKGSKQHIQALDDALARMTKGHEVGIEAEADVVDYTEKVAAQHKQISGKSTEALADNIKSALKQLAGKGNPDEKPPPGYKRVAEIRIVEAENPHYNADAATLQEYLKDMKALNDRVGTTPDADPNAKLEGVGGDLQVRITNGKGPFKFDGPNFDMVK